jgi:hypothetical protein
MWEKCCCGVYKGYNDEQVGENQARRGINDGGDDKQGVGENQARRGINDGGDDKQGAQEINFLLRQNL